MLELNSQGGFMQRIETKNPASTSTISAKNPPPPRQSFASMVKKEERDVRGRNKNDAERRKAGITDLDQGDTRESVAALITHSLHPTRLKYAALRHDGPASAVQHFQLASFSRSPDQISLSFQLCGLSQGVIEVSFKLTGNGLSAAIVVRDERVFRRLNAKRKELAGILKDRGFILEETKSLNDPNENNGGFRK